MQSGSPFRGHRGTSTSQAGAAAGGGRPSPRRNDGQKERARKVQGGAEREAGKRSREDKKRDREDRRRQREAQRRERGKKRKERQSERREERRAAREEAGRKRDETRRRKREKRKEKRQVRRARRRARRLAVGLGLQTMARRFGRLVWPAYTRRLPRAKAVAVLVLNVAPFPGLGTILYGKWERGVVQFLLTFVFLSGWLWAVADGIRIVARAFESQRRSVERTKREAAARR